MSIYALPGELHKLTAASSGPSSDETKSLVKQIARDKCSSCGFCKGPSTTSSSGSQSSLVVDAASDYLSDNDNNPLLRRPNSASSSSSSAADAPPSRKCCCECSVNQVCNNNNDVIIAVNSAKLDHSRLVKSLTVRKDHSKDQQSNKQQSQSANEKEKSVSSSDHHRRPPLASSSSTRKNSRSGSGRRHSTGSTKPSCASSKDNDQQEGSVCCDPHESAIQFEISVSFNGRKYMATRTLPSILKFRNDLIQEFRARRHWYERRRRRSEKKLSVDDNDDSNSSSCSSDDDLSQHDDPVIIPELPRLSDDNNFGPSGFTMINALLRPYGPALEGWLKTVISMVPQDSQCLTQFLWEPLSPAGANNNTTSGMRSKSQRGNTSSSSLGAILETEDHGAYDSDSDEYLLHHCA